MIAHTLAGRSPPGLPLRRLDGRDFGVASNRLPHASGGHTMTAQTLDQPRAAQSPIPLTGWSTIAGGVLIMIVGIPLASWQEHEPTLWWVPTLNAAALLLFFLGVFGLARAGAAGRGGLATGGLGLSMLGLGGLVVANVTWLAGSGAAEVLYPVAMLALLLGLVLTGVAVLRAGRWGGWHRFTPLACGLYIPLVMMPSFALPGLAMHYGLGAWGVCWLLLGVAQLAEA